MSETSPDRERSLGDVLSDGKWHLITSTFGFMHRKPTSFWISEDPSVESEYPFDPQTDDAIHFIVRDFVSDTCIFDGMDLVAKGHAANLEPDQIIQLQIINHAGYITLLEASG